ncbi:MAG TPA: hypothetical protein VM261_20405 [Kofleriaceae bacterium]|nr:hypothetical protein [Kofleriaceae bacterium]
MRAFVAGPVLVGAVAVFAALGACHDGRVRLELSAPAAEDLDPLRDADELTLIGLADGDEVYASTIAAPARGAGLAFDEVPVRDELWFELRATAAAGRVVGFGRAREAVDVSDDTEVRVTIPVRRPFAYLAGADALVTVDATREPGEDYVTMMPVGAGVRAVAGTTDGAEVVVVTTSSVRLVSTMTHAALSGEVVLPSAPSALAVSADGRWAAISHRATPEGLSIVDLQALREGTPVAPAFVAIDRPGALGIGGGVVWVLKDPIDSLFCGGTSSVVSVALDAPAAAAAIPLASRAGDLTVDPATGTAIVNVSCANEVVAIDAPGASPRTLYTAPGVGAVTIAGGRLWMTGHVEGPDAHLSIIDMGLDGSDPHTLALPNTEERAVATALEEAGQDGEIRLTADLHTAFALSVLPDGAHVAILEIAAYIGQASGNAGGGRPIIPEMQMITYEYQLVQLDTGLAAQRLRLSCEISWEPGALLDAFRCARVPGQDEAPVAFTATDLSVLYGSR